MEKVRNLVFVGIDEDVQTIKSVFAKYSKHFAITDEPSEASMMVAVGGDGCILNKGVKKTLLKYNLPVLKVHYRHNFRSSGFTIDVNIGNIKQAIADVLNGRSFTQEIKPLEVWKQSTKEKFHALNDVAITSTNANANVILKTVVKQFHRVLMEVKSELPTPKCSGIVISSAYGSTAWNLSLNGGVVLDDTSECMLLTFRESPLKPDHFIISPSSSIEVSSPAKTNIYIDSREVTDNLAEEPAIIRLSDQTFKMIRTISTYESTSSKLARFNKFQYQCQQVDDR